MKKQGQFMALEKQTGAQIFCIFYIWQEFQLD